MKTVFSGEIIPILLVDFLVFINTFSFIHYIWTANHRSANHDELLKIIPFLIFSSWAPVLFSAHLPCVRLPAGYDAGSYVGLSMPWPYGFFPLFQVYNNGLDSYRRLSYFPGRDSFSAWSGHIQEVPGNRRRAPLLSGVCPCSKYRSCAQRFFVPVSFWDACRTLFSPCLFKNNIGLLGNLPGWIGQD